MRDFLSVLFSIVWKQMRALAFILLFVSATLSFIFGDTLNAVALLAIMIANLLFVSIQEFRARVSVEELSRLVEARVYVERDGELKSLPVSSLNQGNVVHFVAGSVVPVPVHVLEAKSVYADIPNENKESKSDRVHMGDTLPPGTIITSGKVVAYVTEPFDDSILTGYRNKLETVKKLTSFNLFANNLIRYVFVSATVTLVVSMVVLVFGMGKFELLEYFVFSIALLAGVVPGLLSLVITLVLTRESLHLAKDQVVIKRLTSLESLGITEFILADKTGVLTEGTLSVKAVSDVHDFWEASNSISMGEYERSEMDGVYDTALNHSVARVKTGTKRITNFQPFLPDRGYSIFTLEDGSKIARGKISSILGLCEAQKAPFVLNTARSYEEKGFQVVGQAVGKAGEWVFSGFVAFHDPIKQNAILALRLAHERGVAVKIVTEDSDEVAGYLANEVGLIKSLGSMIGLDKRNVSDLSDEELLSVNVFTRCTFEGRLALIKRYEQLGAVTFIGGDIYDAAALERASVGVTSEDQTGIAQEIADVVLVEKDLGLVLRSIARGRKALRNILVYLVYIMAGSAGTFISLLLASFLYPFLPMSPIQIFLTNLLTTLPMILIITDNIDEYSLRHMPHFETGKIIQRILIFGMISSLFDFVYFEIYIKDLAMAEFRTGWFLLSVLAEVALVLSVRSSRFALRAPKMPPIMILGLLSIAMVPFVFIFGPGLARVFQFVYLPFGLVVSVLLMVIAYIGVNEFIKIPMRSQRLYNKPIRLIKKFR